MLFKSVIGIQYVLEDIPLTITFQEITDLLNTKYNTNNNIIYIYAGHTIQLTKTPESEGLSNNNEVFIVTSPIEAPSEVPSEVPSEGYIAKYNGDQIKIAMKQNTNIMLNLIHMIGRQNPFFLSYLAVNPIKADEHIKETLDQQDFVFTVKGDTVLDDPVKPYLLHPSGVNGFEIDQSNMEYILEQCSDYVVTEQSLETARDTYMLLGRDIRKTINALNKPNNSLVGSV